ncbi:unnamed protein product, partial [Amoebophrya sp. A120]
LFAVAGYLLIVWRVNALSSPKMELKMMAKHQSCSKTRSGIYSLLSLCLLLSPVLLLWKSKGNRAAASGSARGPPRPRLSSSWAAGHSGISETNEGSTNPFVTVGRARRNLSPGTRDVLAATSEVLEDSISSPSTAPTSKLYHLTPERCDHEFQILTAEECARVANYELGLRRRTVDPHTKSFLLTVEPLEETPQDLMKHAGCYYDQQASKLYLQTKTDARDRSRNYKSYLAICLVDYSYLHEHKNVQNIALISSGAAAANAEGGSGGAAAAGGGEIAPGGAGGGLLQQRASMRVHGEQTLHTESHILSRSFYPLYFVLLALFISACCQMLQDVLHKVLPFDFPHSVMLYCAGLLLSHFSSVCPDYEISEAVEVAQNIDPKVIFWILLPALLYEDSAKTIWHVGRRVLPNSLLLALPGAILNTVLTG